MEKALIIPPAAEQDEARQIQQIAIWQSVLGKLSEKKITWQQIAAYLPLGSEDPIVHPLACIASDRHGQTLLHLAILQQQESWVDFLGADAQLRQRPSQCGLTPSELAQFLQERFQIASLKAPPSEDLSRISVEENTEPLENFSYISRCLFETPALLEEVLQCSSKAKEGDLIPPERIWMGVYFDKELRSSLSPRLSVRYLNEEIGFGLFAEQKIPACSFVGEYTGIVKEYNKRLMKDKIYCIRYNCWQAGQKRFVIDAETHGNYTRFINHSYEPNLALQSIYWKGVPRMIFISLQEIREGSQLTFDYGRSFWKEINQQPRPIL